jgi:hypothetical protein
MAELLSRAKSSLVTELQRVAAQAAKASVERL